MNKNTISKWFSMFVLMMVAGITGATAQSLTVADPTLIPGKSKVVAIQVAAAAEQTIYGVQTDITLSEGITLEGIAAANTDVEFYKNTLEGGATRVALLSLAGKPIADGDVINLTLKVAASFQGGTISLANSKLTTSTAGAEAALDDQVIKLVPFAGFGYQKYLIINTASGMYWSAGNNWGALASLVPHPEYVKLDVNEDGTYKMESQVNTNGGYYFGGNDYYMDTNSPIALTIKKIEEPIGFKDEAETIPVYGYTIANGENYFGWDGTSTVLGKNLTATDENAVWMIIPLDEAKSALATATVSDPIDATLLIEDHAFGRNNRYQDRWQGAFGHDNHNGNNVAEWYMATGDVYQILANIPNGVYKVDAQAAVTFHDNRTIKAYDGNGYPVIYANDATANFNEMTAADQLSSQEKMGQQFDADLYWIEPIFVEVTDNTLKIGAKSTRSDIWAVWDNFVLTYYGQTTIADAKAQALVSQVEELRDKALDLMNEVENQTVKEDIQTVLTNTATVTTADEINNAITTLKAVIEKAEALIEAKEKLAKMSALISKTNVYTAEAYDTYYNQWIVKYNEGTITKAEAAALQDPFLVTGWQASTTVDNFLLSAWDTNPDFQDAPYYINTWSNEGETDGSNFKVPFFEYFAPSNPLAAKTLTATLTGLEPGYYGVTALVRVAPADKTAESANGITLQANDGKAINVCTGDKFDAEKDRFFVKEFTAYGAVAEDGTLKIKFNVAEGNNIHWLSFQNVKYEKVTKYAINIAQAENGAVAADLNGAAEGETVTLTATPAEGYIVDEAHVTYGENQEVELTVDTEANTATFTMPAADVNVAITFKAGQVGPAPTFDFQNNNGNWTIGEGSDYAKGELTEANPITMDGITLTGIQGEATNAVRYFNNASKGNCLWIFKNNSIKLTAPEGKSITKIDFTMQTGSFDLTPSEGEVVEDTWTGKAVEVTFGPNEKGTRYVYAINVTVEDGVPFVPVISATLEHTASSYCEGDAEVYISKVDAETEHVNNNKFNATWQGAAYAEFSFAGVPANATITEAKLTFKGIGESRNARNTDVMLVNAGETLDYTALAAGTAKVNLDATNIQSVSFPKGSSEVFTIDATEQLNALVAGGQRYAIFKFTNNPGGGDIVGKASEDAPTLVITYELGAPVIANASFEADGEKAASNGPLTLTGWTFAGVGTQYNNTEIRAAESASTTSQFGTSAPKDGNYALFFRQGWNGNGNTITITSDALTEIPSGDYLLSVAYKQHYSYDNTTSNNTFVKLAMVNGEDVLGSAQSPAAAGVSGGSADATYFNDAEWSTLEVPFSVDEAVAAGSQVVITLNAGGQRRSDFFIDNVTLVKVPGIEVALKELEKAIAAAQAQAATYTIGEGLFMYPATEIEPLTRAIATAQEAYTAAESKDAVVTATTTLNQFVAAFAPVATLPDAEKAYSFQLRLGGETPLYMNLAEGGITIAEEATALKFVAVEGADGQYNLTNEEGTLFVGLAGGDAWTMSTLADKKAAWTFTALPDGAYRINNLVTAGRFVGTNAADKEAGKPCYADKKTDNGNVDWLIAEYIPVARPILTLTATAGEEVSLTFGVYDTEDTFGVDFGDGNVVEKKVGVNNAGPVDPETGTTTGATVFTGTVAGDGTIKVYGNNDIWYLVSSGAMPTTLDQAKLMNVVQMTISGANVESVELPAYEKMTQFSFTNSPAKTVNISNVPTLTRIDIFNTTQSVFEPQLTSIDLSKNVNLETIVLGGSTYKKGELTALDVTNNTKLTQISAENNKIASVTGIAATVKNIYLSFNELASLTLPEFENKGTIKIDNNKFTLATLPTKPAITTASKYTYAPQPAYEVAENVSELDLSSQLTATGILTEPATTTYSFVTATTGTALVEGTDYEVTAPGQFKFLKAQEEKVHGVMATEAFPKFTGTNAYVTTDFTVEVVVPEDPELEVAEGWHSVIENGNLATDNVANFFIKENGGDPTPAVIVAGAGKNGSRGIVINTPDNPSTDWDAQFFIQASEDIPAGYKIHVEFDYMATQEAGFDTQSHSAPGDYIHWYCIDSYTANTEWQHMSKEVEVSAAKLDNNQLSGEWGKACDASEHGKPFKTIGFNLSKVKTATVFHFDNITFWVTDVATGIVNVKNEKNNDVIYNLNGLKVNKAQKGLYIINGKKVVIK